MHSDTREARKGGLGSVDDIFTEQAGGPVTRRSSLCSAVPRAVPAKPFCTSASSALGSGTAQSGRRGPPLRAELKGAPEGQTKGEVKKEILPSYSRAMNSPWRVRVQTFVKASLPLRESLPRSLLLSLLRPSLSGR